jgi:hypothetical protein
MQLTTQANNYYLLHNEIEGLGKRFSPTIFQTNGISWPVISPWQAKSEMMGKAFR